MPLISLLWRQGIILFCFIIHNAVLWRQVHDNVMFQIVQCILISILSVLLITQLQTVSSLQQLQHPGQVHHHNHHHQHHLQQHDVLAWIIFLNWVAFLLGKILFCFNNVLRLNCWLMILITLNFPESELHNSMRWRNYYRGILFITTRMVGWYNIQEDYNAFEKIKRSLPSFSCN